MKNPQQSWILFSDAKEPELTGSPFQNLFPASASTIPAEQEKQLTDLIDSVTEGRFSSLLIRRIKFNPDTVKDENFIKDNFELGEGLLTTNEIVELDDMLG